MRERTAVITGIADSTMTRDEGWHFLVLGRSIERVDMTARLLSTSALSPGPNSAWPTTLRACGAYETFLRAYRGIETDREAAEFLLLDRLFPRSVVHAADPGRACLANLEATGQRSASRTRRSACSAGPAPSWSTARSPTSCSTCRARWSGCSAPARRPATP